MRIEIKLTILAIAMFGFGYALVPLYDVFCAVTGLNGKTGTIAQEQAEQLFVDPDRMVTVEFDTNVNGSLPWSFRAMEHRLKVHPGEITDALFVVENHSNKTVVGQAVPSVAPAQASLFFNKTECFCFTQQTLAPGERKEILVRFVVGAELPKKISTLTLSYTYFMVPETENVVRQKSPALSLIVDENNI
jgi:cytochrome c oxidase assembly protein subunit 11